MLICAINIELVAELSAADAEASAPARTLLSETIATEALESDSENALDAELSPAPKASAEISLHPAGAVCRGVRYGGAVTRYDGGLVMVDIESWFCE